MRGAALRPGPLAWALLAALVLVPGCAGLSVAPPGARPDDLGRSVARSARTQIGSPYRWGGQSPAEGFDCSGLVWWAFRQNGLAVPRPSWEQQRAGRAVSEGRLALGDVVFFRIESGIKGLHAGIVSGPGLFVHSPKSGGRVREDPLDNPYWRERYIGARRLP